MQNTSTTASRNAGCFSNCPAGAQNGWYVVGASATGKGHLSDGTPCQDNHIAAMIHAQWGIAVVCDGAGSAKLSEEGAHFVTRKAFDVFKARILETEVHLQPELPHDETWSTLASDALRDIYAGLEAYAKATVVDLSALSCTIMVVVFSPAGLLATHIGDGRGAYRKSSGEWVSLFIPHKGEEANQTVFITSQYWREPPGFRVSGVAVPECSVIREQPSAFALLSDGCEKHSFDCSKLDAVTGKWSDPNIPFKGFFEPVYTTLRGMKSRQLPLAEANIKWMDFVSEGSAGLKNEPDDKTMVVGILN